MSYYYQEGSKRHSTKIKGLEETEEADMSNFEVIRPEPAGTKEEPDYVPSVNISSVRNMFEKPQVSICFFVSTLQFTHSLCSADSKIINYL